VLKGPNPGNIIDVYEVFLVFAAAVANTNSTRNGERCLFTVRRENGRWHMVGDFRRSIYEVSSGYHARLPLDNSRPFWERYALMNYWISADQDGSGLNLVHLFLEADPGTSTGLVERSEAAKRSLKAPTAQDSYCRVLRASCDGVGAGRMPQCSVRLRTLQGPSRSARVRLRLGCGPRKAKITKRLGSARLFRVVSLCSGPASG
jgi:hypothetical protein